MPLVESKDFNALIFNRPLFDQPVKKKQEAHEKLVEMSRNDDYITENFLHYLYHQRYCKCFEINLSRLTNTSIPQQINEIAEKQQKTQIAEKQQKTFF